MIIDHKSRIQTWIVAVLLFCAMVVALFTLGSFGIIKFTPHNFGLNFDLACIGLTVSIVIVLVIYYLDRKKFDFFEFPVWFTLNIYIQIILNVWLFQRDYRFYSPWLHKHSRRDGS